MGGYKMQMGIEKVAFFLVLYLLANIAQGQQGYCTLNCLYEEGRNNTAYLQALILNDNQFNGRFDFGAKDFIPLDRNKNGWR